MDLNDLFGRLQIGAERLSEMFIEDMRKFVENQRNGCLRAYNHALSYLLFLTDDEKQAVIRGLLSSSDLSDIDGRDIMPLYLLLKGYVRNKDDWNLICAEQHWCVFDFFMLLRRMCDLVSSDNAFGDQNVDREKLVKLWNELFLPLIEFCSNLDSGKVDLCDPDINKIFTEWMTDMIAKCSFSIVEIMGSLGGGKLGFFPNVGMLRVFVGCCNDFVLQWISSVSAPRILAYGLLFMRAHEVEQIVDECCSGIISQLGVAQPAVRSELVVGSDLLSPSECSC